MKFKLQETDIHGKPIGEPVELDIDVTEEELEKERKIWCNCGYLEEENPKDDPEYTDGAYIKEIDTHVNKHGWLCPRCKKYVQIG